MIEEFAVSHSLPSFRIKQYNQAVYQQYISSFEELTTWPKSLRQELKQKIKLFNYSDTQDFVSRSGDTVKTLLTRVADGKMVEAVLMRHRDGRNTVCVSCMVGCPVGCRFCATGKMGFGAMLSADEIIDQVLYFARRYKQITNVVFMGMGEPMLNLKAVLGAISVLTDPEKIGFGQRRIVVSTSGYLPQFRQLIKSGFRGRVAISLHAPNQKLRAQLMPVAKIYPLNELFAAMDEFVSLTNKRVSYEYLLIDGVNDQDKHARQLTDLLKNRLAHVNLIPYNPIQAESYQRSSAGRVSRFKILLSQAGIPCTIRVTMGDDIAAACGQLAGKFSTGNST